MLGHAARHADIWNTMSFAPARETQLAEARERVVAIDARCAKIGRDLKSLRRSWFMSSLGSDTPLYESDELFAAFAQELIAIGFTDLVLSYPTQDARAQRSFERIARNVLPRLRAARCASGS